MKCMYILFPHSMSGIEALYWAQQYPNEVKGIVGLDMAVPESYKNYQINGSMLNASSLGSNVGIPRFLPAIVDDSASIKYGTPDVPMLFFISNGDGTGWDKNKWIDTQVSYIKTKDSNKYIKLDVEHYIHNIEYDKIAEESSEFIKDIINTSENN